MTTAAGLGDLVETVRRRLAAEPGDLTPHRVADALRAAGRPVGDASVLAVYEASTHLVREAEVELRNAARAGLRAEAVRRVRVRWRAPP